MPSAVCQENVTSLAATALRVTANLAVPPSVAVMAVDTNVSVAVSSSEIVSVWSEGAATPLPPVAVADTVTSLSAVTTELSLAVIVTVPVLVVAPAAIVRVVPLCVKSPDTAGDTGEEETVSVTASVDAAFSVAVTAVEPPFSEIEEEPRTRETVRLSSSVIVRVLSDGPATPLPPETVAETVTFLSGPSTVLFTAVIVTAPVLVVAPAAMVSVLLVLRLKSEDVAGETAVAETVSVTASVETALSVAVTAVEPPFSEIDEEPRTRETVGALSSSVIVNV